MSGISESRIGFFSQLGQDPPNETSLVHIHRLLYHFALHGGYSPAEARQAADCVFNKHTNERRDPERTGREAVSHKLRSLSQSARKSLSAGSSRRCSAHAGSRRS